MTEINRRILVIDDDRDIWKAYKLILEPEETDKVSSLAEMNVLLGKDTDSDSSDDTFSVHYAAQGQDGFAIVEKCFAENRPFALAFIDIRMPPGWDGMKTAQRPRNRNCHCHRLFRSIL